MKWLFILFLLSQTLDATSALCQQKHQKFLIDEQAYDVVVSIAVAGKKSYEIIGEFVESSQDLLQVCSNTLTLDKQYTLKRKLKKARRLQSSYRVYTQAQVKAYAISHPEEIVVYKWGTIRPVR